MNGYVRCPPGEEPALNENQIKQAFFDSMLSTWRKRFIQAGHSNSLMTLAQVLRYFRQQETLAVRKQIENKKFQCTFKKFSKGNKKSTSSENHQADGDRKIHLPARKTFKKSSSANKRKVLDTDPCPIHDHPHLWGVCRANYYSQMKKTKTDNSDKSSKKPASAKAAFPVNHTDEEDTDQASDTVMNEDDDEQESGIFQAVSTASSESNSSFALTVTFVSFDLQNQINNSTEAGCYKQYITNLFVTGDDYSEKEIIDNNIDVSTSLSLRPIRICSTQIKGCRPRLRERMRDSVR
jgi:hypothetical protein